MLEVLPTKKELAKKIDHTSLDPSSTYTMIRNHCNESVKVRTVIGFPLGIFFNSPEGMAFNVPRSHRACSDLEFKISLYQENF